MGLKIPDLDDREYARILEDARERIPIHAEEWTDHNVHDPGITILETLAWLAESYGYQLDRVTDAHRRKYLKLMGTRPAPPRRATATLRLALPATEEGDGEAEEGAEASDATVTGRAPGATVPAGETLTAEDASGRVESFRTAAPVTLTGASIERVIAEHRGGRTDNTDANDTPGMHFLGFGEDAHAGSAMYLGFDGDPFEGVGTLDLALAFHEADLPEPVVHGEEPSAFDPSVTVAWEYCTDYGDWFLETTATGEDVWRPFEVRHDGTNRLYRGGTVRLARPQDWTGEPASKADRVLDVDEELVWIRCRIGRPERGDAGHEVPPQFDDVAVNTVEARHGVQMEPEILERVDGGTETTALPGQTFTFGRRPVLPGSDGDGTTVLVGPGDPRGLLDAEWTEVSDFDASGPDDRDYVLDRAEGTIRFGDEVRGASPVAGQRVLAGGFLHGGGPDGNVPASAAWGFERDELTNEGVYTFYSGADPSTGTRGAVVVGTPEGSEEDAAVDYGDWFRDANGAAGTVDRRGDTTEPVEISVGVGTADGPAFSPMAVRVDPGTPVRFVWAADGHSVVVEDRPPGSDWSGHPTPEAAGYEFTHTFERTLDLSEIRVHPRGPAEGGRDAESIEEALDRLKADLRVPYRSVTLDDWATIAESTPGLRFGRAKAFVDAGDDPPDCNRRPAVRVVVVPFSPLEKPVPSSGFLEAVDCHLERHRLLTDRVEVDPPTYVGIGVDVEIQILPGYSGTERAAAVDAGLREFLHPLEGFEGDGWPFGRPVYRSELYEVIEGIDGIDCVLDVDVTASGPDARYRDGDVEIGPSSLVYSEDHDVVVRAGRDDCGVGA